MHFSILIYFNYFQEVQFIFMIFSPNVEILNLARKYTEMLNADVYHKNLLFRNYDFFST